MQHKQSDSQTYRLLYSHCIILTSLVHVAFLWAHIESCVNCSIRFLFFAMSSIFSLYFVMHEKTCFISFIRSLSLCCLFWFYVANRTHVCHLNTTARVRKMKRSKHNKNIDRQVIFEQTIVYPKITRYFRTLAFVRQIYHANKNPPANPWMHWVQPDQILSVNK